MALLRLLAGAAAGVALAGGGLVTAMTAGLDALAGSPASYASASGGSATPAAVAGTPAQVAVAFARAQIGVPYRWGGDGPGGFDCSGLTQAAYAAAGVGIPRTSELQWSDLPHVALGSLTPGDLVFFNPGEFTAGQPGHVGIYVGGGEFIDAPHTGATVRVDDLVVWGQPFGAARPG